jgi:hypothetical protein
VDIVIEADLRSWSREVLEVPNAHLKGLPPCPYAAKAWRDDKVLVVESEDLFADSIKHCEIFDTGDKELVIIATFDLPEPGALHALSEELNDRFPTLHCMTFHPEYDADDAGLDFLTDNEWESGVSEDYAMLFVQGLAQVVAASDRLQPLGYYDVYPPDEYEALVTNRKRRLTHGDETSQNDQEEHLQENDARRHG